MMSAINSVQREKTNEVYWKQNRCFTSYLLRFHEEEGECECWRRWWTSLPPELPSHCGPRTLGSLLPWPLLPHKMRRGQSVCVKHKWVAEGRVLEKTQVLASGRLWRCSDLRWQVCLPPRTQREVLHLNAGWRTPENCVVLEKIRTSPLNGKVPVCQAMKSKRAPLSLNGQKIHLKQKRVKVPGLWQDDWSLTGLLWGVTLDRHTNVLWHSCSYSALKEY